MSKMPPKVNKLAPAKMEDKPSYRSLLGEAAWKRLHPEIRERFCATDKDAFALYRGSMDYVKLSPAGKVFAHLCRIIGTPLALYCGKNVPIDVQVYVNPKLGGMTWDRYYHYQNKQTNRVRSTKCIDAKLGLIEVVGAGFAMNLKIYEDQGAMGFISTRFFCKIGAWRIPIPSLLTPGKTVVEQRVLDNGHFQFSLHVTHPWLGQVFAQQGCFKQVNEDAKSE